MNGSFPTATGRNHSQYPLDFLALEVCGFSLVLSQILALLKTLTQQHLLALQHFCSPSMGGSFIRFLRWLGGGKEKEPHSNGSTRNSSSESGFTLKEPDTLKFPLVKGTKIAPFPSRVKRKWQSREQRRIETEYDFVLVPSDGAGCLSGSESDDSDWAIGLLEPHGADFQSDDESDNSFAVLFPCYKPGSKKLDRSTNLLLSTITNVPNPFSSGSMNYMEQWLPSHQNFES